MTGYTDTPITKDQLGVKNYYKALSEFIKTCSMPMTISIEGDWGVGKTTAMKHIQEFLRGEEHIRCITMDMWPYSIYESDIAITLIRDFCRIMQKENVVSSTKFEKLTKKALSIVKAAGMAAGTYTGATDFRNVMSELSKVTEEYFKDVNTVYEIQEFKKELVNSIGEENRLVVFMDDLDRLNPKSAMEVIEALKIFLDCERCVFVLAVDFNVVSRGVQYKYGENFDENKAKKFFEKIIQLQFHLPVEQYNIRNYLIEQFEIKRDNAEKYEMAIRNLLDTNPRNIKRVFNLFQLHKLMASGKKTDDFILFVLILIQLHNQKLFENLIAYAQTTDDDEPKLAEYSIRDLIRNTAEFDLEEDEEKGVLYRKNIDNILGLDIFKYESQKEDGYNKTAMKRLVSGLNNAEKSIPTINIVSDKKVKIGVHVRQVFEKMLDDNVITDKVLAECQDKEWSKDTFGFSYPMLLEYDENRSVPDQIRRTNVYRWYVTPYQIGKKKYFLCSQWYESKREKFNRWVERIYKENI